jgi:hypothetical protein
LQDQCNRPYFLAKVPVVRSVRTTFVSTCRRLRTVHDWICAPHGRWGRHFAST